MNEIDHKLDVLSRIAKAFNDKRITWAVGASLLLYLKDKVNGFHDIDILVMVEDVDMVKAMLLELGNIMPPNPNLQYKTKHFMEFKIDDVDIDVMAGFVIVSNGVEYDCSLKKKEIAENVVINGQVVYLHSLALWKRYYELMGRKDKAHLI